MTTATEFDLASFPELDDDIPCESGHCQSPPRPAVAYGCTKTQHEHWHPTPLCQPCVDHALRMISQPYMELVCNVCRFRRPIDDFYVVPR